MKKKLFTLFLTLSASVTMTFGAKEIDVTDCSLADWNSLPSGYVVSAVCPSDAKLLGLKSVKVYATEMYINILVEPNMDKLPDLEWVPFHIFIDADNSDTTGGYGDEFLDANADLLVESGLFLEGDPYTYNPAVYRWWGEVGGAGWDYWTDPSVEHDPTDYWGAIIGEGQLPVGNSQYVDGKFEIQIFRDLLGTCLEFPMNDSEFGIGFDIQQYWSSVGILPCASATETNPSGLAKKLKVKICKDKQSIESISPSDADIQKLIRDGQILILRGDKTYTLQGQEVK